MTRLCPYSSIYFTPLALINYITTIYFLVVNSGSKNLPLKYHSYLVIFCFFYIPHKSCIFTELLWNNPSENIFSVSNHLLDFHTCFCFLAVALIWQCLPHHLKNCPWVKTIPTISVVKIWLVYRQNVPKKVLEVQKYAMPSLIGGGITCSLKYLTVMPCF